MREVVIVDAVRTPTGRFRGSLKEIRADHLGAIVLNALVARTGISVNEINDVVFGCVTQVGEQCGNVARTSVLSAGWPETIPGVSIDRKCGSGEAAVQLAAAQIAMGTFDVIAAGGVENMSRVPMGGNRDVHGETFGWRLRERFEMVSQGEAAERITDLWKLTRAELDAFSLESHRRAIQAIDEGRFDSQITPVDVDAWREKSDAAPSGVVLMKDETPRRDTTLERLSGLKTVFRPEGGRVTAGNSSQISDGAAAMLLMSADKAKELGLKPRARIRMATVVGSDPTLMLTGPISATRKILAKTGLTTADVDIFEVNEAFAPVPMVWMKELGVSHEKLNVNGGAVALGHPLGASGARIMTTMLNELERRGGTFAMQSICCAGGLGTATLLERLN